jgi:hypothetical protein
VETLLSFGDAESTTAVLVAAVMSPA